MTGRLRIDSLVVKIAELCNLNCRYCYLYNHGDTTFKGRPRFMTDTVFDGLLKSVGRYCDAEPGRAVSITFHGGEPTLVGPRRLVELAARGPGNARPPSRQSADANQRHPHRRTMGQCATHRPSACERQPGRPG